MGLAGGLCRIGDSAGGLLACGGIAGFAISLDAPRMPIGKR
jgi:hypothetical protein